MFRALSFRGEMVLRFDARHWSLIRNVSLRILLSRAASAPSSRRSRWKQYNEILYILHAGASRNSATKHSEPYWHILTFWHIYIYMAWTEMIYFHRTIMKNYIIINFHRKNKKTVFILNLFFTFLTSCFFACLYLWAKRVKNRAKSPTVFLLVACLPGCLQLASWPT